MWHSSEKAEGVGDRQTKGLVESGTVQENGLV